MYDDAKKLPELFPDIHFVSLIEQCIKNKENIAVEPHKQWWPDYCEHIQNQWSTWWEPKGCKITYSRSRNILVLWYIER